MTEPEPNKDESAVSDPAILKAFFFAALKYMMPLVVIGYFLGMDFQIFVFYTMMYFLILIFTMSGKPHIPADKNIYEDAADTIDRFLDGTCGDHEWDALLSRGMNGDYRYIEMQRRLDETRGLYPPLEKSEWCSADGREVIKNVGELIQNPNWKLEELRSIA